MFDLDIVYNAPPTISRFMRSNAFGRLIAGPVGSGKTHGLIIETALRRAMEQAPAYDGKRYTRGAIIRQTLTQLKSTVLKDLLHICKGHAEFISSKSEVHIKNEEMDCEIMLVPLEDPKDQQRLLSSQLTWAWFSEVIEISLELVGPVAGRIGRYPNGDLGAPTWSGMMADTNFPVEGSEWWKFMEKPPSTWEVYKQPGGLDPAAENLTWLGQTAESLMLPEGHETRVALGRAYYTRLLATGSKAWGDRYVHALYGADPSGMAVFGSSFKRSFHVRDKLEPESGRILLLGQDFGRNPWTLICQLDHKGRLLVLEEVAGVGIGLDQHLRENLRPAMLQARYMGLPTGVIGDPSAIAKSSLFEINEYDLLKDHGYIAQPAPTNDIEPRIRSVEKFLLGQRQGEGEILIDGSRCPKLVFALSGGYRYSKTRLGELQPKPEKNEFSHVCDCLQCVCLVAGSPGAYSMLRTRTLNRGRPTRHGMPVGAWT